MTLSNPDYTVMNLTALTAAHTASSLGIALDGSTSFSIDAWIRFAGLGANTAILSQGTNFAFGAQGEALFLQIAGLPIAQSNPVITQDWHYVCVTYTSSGQVRFYVDGYMNLFVSISGSGSSGTTPFLIGNGLQGSVRNVRVFNRALPASTVMDCMFNTPAPASIVCWFDFSQSPPKDLGSGNLPISLQGGAQMVISSPALAMVGTAFAQPLRDESVNPGGLQVDPYTVQAWVYPTATSPLQQSIFANGGDESDFGIGLYLQWNGSSAFNVVSERGAVGNGETLSSTGTIPLNVWSNVATTFDGTTLSIYINGTLDTSQPFGPLPLISVDGLPIVGATYSEGQPSGANSLQGYISDVEVWSICLTAAQLMQYMTDPPDPGTAGVVAVYDFTNAATRNQVTRHPVALADGASVGEQFTPAASGGSGLTRRIRTATPPEPLDENTLQEIRESLDLQALVEESTAAFETAMQSDLAAFGDDPAAQEKIGASWSDALDRLRNDPASARYLVTQHRVGEERVLLCHRNGQSYVVYRGPVDDIDSCTMWKVQLVFVVIGGVLDAVFGLTTTLSTKAANFIVRVVTNPVIASTLAAGTGISARGLLSIMTSVYNQGFLMDIVKLIATIGFWTIVRVGAKLALYAAGAGVADLIASLAATVTTFILTWNSRPSSCNPIPTVNLAAIKFNWDPTGVSTDAINIRGSYSTAAPFPEWTPARSAAADSPAAYSIANVTGKAVTIQAKFTSTSLAPFTATISATGGGILGAIPSFSVSFNGGVSVPEFVTISVPSHTFGAGGGVGIQNVTWTWTYQSGGSSAQPLATTNHRIYSLLAVPTGPWQQNGAPSQAPWIDLLEYSCVWAAGATNANAAATAITTKVNGAINLTYDVVNGRSVYTEWIAAWGAYGFLASQFLQFLKSGGGKGRTVNCTDCAAIVVAFANSVGCNLFASWMSNPNAFTVGVNGFACTEIIAIGTPTWAYPFPHAGAGFFRYHEVGWTGAGSYGDPLYDACLQLDNSSNPWNWPGGTHVAQLPLQVPFTTQPMSPSLPIATPFTSWSYRERLCTNNAAGIGTCTPLGPLADTASGRRRVQ